MEIGKSLHSCLNKCNRATVDVECDDLNSQSFFIYVDRISHSGANFYSQKGHLDTINHHPGKTR